MHLVAAGLGGVDHVPAGSALHRGQRVLLPQHLLHPADEAASAARQRAHQLPEGGAGLLRPRPSLRPPVARHFLQVQKGHGL